ncbi:YbfB/YjiJ family MFS transporter [Longispora sp. NPDC051575]|uniref:YbfB/YjiJ family MFS transporter n=1 Tax=Longispora sp. NPDC051575 TaxID=3154943 RepID=UPI003448639A
MIKIRAALLSLGPASAVGLARFSYGLFVPAMRADLGWSLAKAGSLTAANGLGYLAGAALTGLVVRRLGPGRTFRTGMVLTVVGLAGGALGGYPGLLLTRALAGIACALVFVTGSVLAARLATAAGSAAPIAIYFAGAGLGVAGCGAVLPVLLDGHPERWPVGWLVLAGGAALATVGSWRVAGAGTGAEVGPGTGWQGLGRWWPLGVVYLLFGAGYIAYLTFLSAYLAARQSSMAVLVGAWVLLGVAAVSAPAVWSRPLAAWPGARPLAALLASVATAAALPLGCLSVPTLALSAAGFGLTFMMVPAGVTTLLRAAAPGKDPTSVLGGLTVLFATGQMLGPWLAGLIADQTTPAAALAWTAVLCGLAAGCALWTTCLPRGAG